MECGGCVCTQKSQNRGVGGAFLFPDLHCGGCWESVLLMLEQSPDDGDCFPCVSNDSGAGTYTV